MSSRNRTGYYAKCPFAVFPMLEKLSCSVSGYGRLSCSDETGSLAFLSQSISSLTVNTYCLTYTAELLTLPPPAPDTHFATLKHSLLRNTWSQPKAQDEGKYRCHAHIRHPWVQFLEQKRMRRFSSDFDNPVLKFGLTVTFPFAILCN